MSTATISEYVSLAEAQTGIAMCGQEPCLARQNITFTGTAGTSSAFNAQTKFVRVHVDGIAGYRFGATAVATDPRMAADQTEYFGVSGGGSVSFITRT